MEEKIELIKKDLTEISEELFKKYGTDSYSIRCAISDVKDSVSKLHQPTVSGSVCECSKLPKGEIAISSKAISDPNWTDGQTER